MATKNEFKPEAITDLAVVERKTHSADASRMIFWYDVPARVAEMTGIARVGMIELTSSEEMQATRRAGNDAIRLAYELAKESVRYVNDSRVISADGTSDVFWGAPKRGMSALRQMCLTAYGVIHNPKPEEVSTFIASQAITLGG